MSRWYAGCMRTEEGIARHQAARNIRMNRPVNRIKADLRSSHNKRTRRTNGTGTQR